MPPRDQELPEGTDQIINGAMETGAGAGASTGSSGGESLGGGGFGGTGSGGTTPGGSADFASGTGFTSTAGTGTTGSSGFIGAGGSGTASDGTGGFASGSTGSGISGGSSAGASEDFGGSALGGSASAGLGTSSGGGGGFGGASDLGGGGGGSGGSFGGGSEGSSSGGGVKQQVKSQVQNLQGQATDKVRAYAVDGKQRATTALTDLSQVVQEAAQSIEERLGPQYGDYARRAASTVSGLADTIDRKDVDELFDDARDLIRKSPGIAIGAAAVIGFTLVRLVKAGMPDQQSTDVQFQPDSSLTTSGSEFGGAATGSTGSYGTTGTSPSGSTTTGSQAPYVAPTNTGV